MRKLLLWLVLSLCAGGVLYQFMLRDKGYVLVSYGGTSVETTLWMLIAVFVVVALVLWLIAFLLKAGIKTVSGIVSGLSNRREKKARKLAGEGLLDYLEGHWSRARLQLERSAAKTDAPMLNYLLAARAASEEGDHNKASDNLAKAETSADSDALVIEITKARLHIQAGHYEEALAALMRCRKKDPRHPLVLNMLRTVYEKLGAWDELNELLPILKTTSVLTGDEFEALQEQVYADQLTRFRDSQEIDSEKAGQLWKSMSKNLKRRSRLLGIYVDILVESGRESEAERLLREGLKRDWHEELVTRYGCIRGEDLEKQLLLAENWLKSRPGNGNLLLSLGRISLSNELWGKAREYFAGAIEQGRGPEAYAEQARLLAHLGEYEESNNFYQQGLMLSASKLPSLPMPEEHSIN